MMVWVVTCAGAAFAQSVPATVSFTARLADDGAPVQGTKLFTFKLYPTVAGGTEAWSEQQQLTVADGNVSAELGASMPLNEMLLSGARLYLEVSVDGAVLSPRTPLVSVPYAIRSGVTGRLGALAEADVQRRVSSACPVNSSIRAIDAMGTVTCQSASVMSVGDGGTAISGVFAGAGLTGGGSSGDVTLSVSFAGPGAATTAARSDHTHAGAYLPAGASLACPGTDKVTGLNAATGNVSCGADAVGVTSITAGAGLTGGTITSSGTIGLASTVQNWPSQPVCPAGSVLRGVSASGVATCDPAGGSGTVTSVTAGAGLTGGTITSSGTLGLAATVQNWSSQPACPAGSYLRAVGATGSPTCATDTDTNSGGTVTSVTAGAGLTGGTITSSGTLGLAATVQNWSSQPACPAGSYLRAVSASGSPTCATDVAGSGTVTQITAGAGLTGGTITSSGTLGLASTVQNWPSQPDCPPGTAVTAIASTGTTTCSPTFPTAYGKLGFALVSLCTTNGPCTVDSAYASVSGGGSVTATRMGPGFYTVTFNGLNPTSAPFGNVQVTSNGLGNVHCKVSNWASAPGAPIAPIVLCYNGATSAATDSAFSIFAVL